MIIKENVTVYVCEYCKKKLFREHAMVNHESTCDKNPLNHKACFGCVHLDNDEVEYYVGYHYDGDPIEKTSGCFKCKKFDKLMFTWNAEKLKLPEKYPETFEDQKRMPNSCRHFQQFEYNNEPIGDLPF